MSATTFNATSFTAAEAAVKAPRQPLIKRIVARIIAGQERRARIIVQAHLANHSDDALARLGWSQSDIAALRRSTAR